MYESSDVPTATHRGPRPRVSVTPNIPEPVGFATSDPDWIGGGAGCLTTMHLHAPAEREPHEPRESHTDAAVRVAEALAVCRVCPMLDTCREWAFRTQPTGVVVAGMDLTPARAQVPEAFDEVDHDIYMGRAARIAEDLGITFTSYQHRFIADVIAGRNPSWQHGGGRKGHKAQVDEILTHPDLGLERDRAAS